MSVRQFNKHYLRVRNDQKDKSTINFASVFSGKSFTYTLHYKEFWGISIRAHMCDLLMVFISYAGVNLEHKHWLLSYVFSAVHSLSTAKQEMPAIHNTSLLPLLPITQDCWCHFSNSRIHWVNHWSGITLQTMGENGRRTEQRSAVKQLGSRPTIIKAGLPTLIRTSGISTSSARFNRKKQWYKR